MPSWAVFQTSPRAMEMLGDVPPIMREVPEVRAILYGDAKETERQEATIAALRAEMFPQTATAVGLPWHERLFQLTQAPPGLTEAERQDTVLGAALRLNQDPTGADWEDGVTLILGTTAWTYREHDPADPTTPDPYVIEIVLPFSPANFDYGRAETLIRAQGPAGWDYVLTYVEGFELGESQLGEEPL